MSLEVYFSYHSHDEDLCNELAKHLGTLKRQGVITDWYDRDIIAGSEVSREKTEHLASAHIILLLISPDFIASDDCYDNDLALALKRHAAGKARVIPILLRPVDWKGTPFSQLQILPSNGKPVTLWEKQDEALLNIAQGIRRAAEELSEERLSSSISSPRLQANMEPWKSENRHRAQKHSELQRQYDLLTEELDFLRTSERIDDLTPKERFRLKKQIQATESERGTISDELDRILNS